MNRENWWRKYFEEYYLLVEGVKPKEVTLRSADFIEQAFELPKGSRILDLGCGYGRLSLELAKRGYSVVGLDFSPRLLEMAKELARREGIEVEFVQRDMRRIDYHNEFDGILSWDTSFGYFSDEENEQLLGRIARDLKVGGKLVLDLHNRDAYLRRHLGKTWKRDDDHLILEEMTFDLLRSRFEVRGLLVWLKTGFFEEYTNSFREYTLPELQRLLAGAGLEIQDIYGDFEPYEAQKGLEYGSIQTCLLYTSPSPRD